MLSSKKKKMDLCYRIYAETLLTNQTGWLTESSGPGFMQVLSNFLV